MKTITTHAQKAKPDTGIAKVRAALQRCVSRPRQRWKASKAARLVGPP